MSYQREVILWITLILLLFCVEPGHACGYGTPPVEITIPTPNGAP